MVYSKVGRSKGVLLLVRMYYSRSNRSYVQVKRSSDILFGTQLNIRLKQNEEAPSPRVEVCMCSSVCNNNMWYLYLTSADLSFLPKQILNSARTTSDKVVDDLVLSTY